MSNAGKAKELISVAGIVLALLSMLAGAIYAISEKQSRSGHKADVEKLLDDIEEKLDKEEWLRSRELDREIQELQIKRLEALTREAERNE